MTSPFKFLDAYELKDKAHFFGRDQEIEALYEMVFRTPILLIYGASGTGKTSLVQCGLASRFDGPEWYPFYVRKNEDINTSLRTALTSALEESEGLDSTPALVKEIFEEYLSPIYLIFDQFEELFILGTAEEQDIFARDIKKLLAAELPCKLLFIIREEYLGHLYNFETIIPTLFNFRLRVEPMNNLKVQKVLQASFDAFNISLEHPAEDRLQEIIDNVSGRKSGIQLPYLQVYLDMLYREDLARTYGEATAETTGSQYPVLEFTKAEIEAFGQIEEVLNKFLKEQEEQLQTKLEKEYKDFPEFGLRHVLDAFVTEEGTKRPIRMERSEADNSILIEEKQQRFFPALAHTALTHCLEELERNRLLRYKEETLELAHDSLAALIDQKRSDEQRQLNEIKLRLNSSFREWQRTKVYLTRRQLLSMEEYLPRLPLSEELQQFWSDSEQDALKTEREKEAQQQRELQLAEEKLASERRGRRITRLLLGIMSVVAIAAIFSAVYARQQSKIAQEQTIIANDKTAEAEEQKQLAQEGEAAAKRSDALAQEALQRAEAEQAKAEAALAAQRLADVKALLAQAEEQLGKNQYEEALRSFRAALQRASTSQQAAIRQAIAETESAQAAYNFERNKQRGLRLAEAGECAAAEIYMQKALAQAPDDEALKQAFEEALEKCRE